MLAIQLNNVWKKYYIEYKKRGSLKKVFLDFLRKKPKSEFYALRNISLDVRKGETLGIVGKNGSGKTTLLKLLCGVAKETKGSIKVNGRVSGLLELGAGFQGDLTGRENIYLNGSILGLSHKEIQKDIDSIINFADIGNFIDAPVRTYSAGMYVRLGFAIAAQLDPDILLIDEVLAVGDESFQKKCLKKIESFRNKEKTIIFVSHNLDMVRRLCERAILMDKGCIVCGGDTEGVINRYFSLIDKKELLWPTKEIEITGVYFKNDKDEIVDTFEIEEEMRIIIEYFAPKKIEKPVFGIGVYKDDVYLIGPNTRDSGYKIDYVYDRGIFEYIIKKVPFAIGRYKVSVCIHNVEETYIYDSRERLYEFFVVSGKEVFKHGITSVEGVWEFIKK